jgi:hypothetical protein
MPQPQCVQAVQVCLFITNSVYGPLRKQGVSVFCTSIGTGISCSGVALLYFVASSNKYRSLC